MRHGHCYGGSDNSGLILLVNDVQPAADALLPGAGANLSQRASDFDTTPTGLGYNSPATLIQLHPDFDQSWG